MADRNDETWIAELKGRAGKQRQEEAFHDLGNALLPPVCWYLSNRAALPPGLAHGSQRDLDQLARDIVQESLLLVWRKGLGLYRGEARFLTYAKSIVINQARQTLRRMWRRQEEPWPSHESAGTDEEDADVFPITAHSEAVIQELPPESQVTLARALQCVDRILTEQCTPREREAFAKKYLDGSKSKEIAEAMDVTERAVNLLTFSARRKLRQGLDEEGYTLEGLLATLER